MICAPKSRKSVSLFSLGRAYREIAGAWPWPSRSGLQLAAAGSVRSGPCRCICFSDSLSIASLHPILKQKQGTMQPPQLTVKTLHCQWRWNLKLLTVWNGVNSLSCACCLPRVVGRSRSAVVRYIFTVPPIFNGRRDIANCFRDAGAAASLRYIPTWTGTGSI
jgi:hypothetical protein